VPDHRNIDVTYGSFQFEKERHQPLKGIFAKNATDLATSSYFCSALQWLSEKIWPM
jgi:hypothetical protein